MLVNRFINEPINPLAPNHRRLLFTKLAQRRIILCIQLHMALCWNTVQATILSHRRVRTERTIASSFIVTVLLVMHLFLYTQHVTTVFMSFHVFCYQLNVSFCSFFPPTLITIGREAFAWSWKIILMIHFPSLSLTHTKQQAVQQTPAMMRSFVHWPGSMMILVHSAQSNRVVSI